MKNKNFLYMGILIAFIFLYSEFVVKPYNEKNKKPLPVETLQPNTATPSTSSVIPPVSVNGAVVASTVNNADQSKYLTTEDKASPSTISLGSSRSLTLFSKGAISTATLGDFNVRGSKTPTPVVLMQEGFKWSSDDAQVSRCLANLRATENNLKFSSASSTVSSLPFCTLEYKIHPEKSGLISARLELGGFSNSKGFVELRGVDALGLENPEAQPTLSYYLNESKESLHAEKIFESHPLTQGKLSWVVWGDRYFASALLPRGTYNPNFIYGGVDPTKAFVAKENPPLFFGLQYPLSGQQGPMLVELDMLFTQRDPNFMATIQPDLEKAVELGYFAAIAKALIFALKLIYRIVGNYGIAIIILTLIARIVFWPLNKKVFESGRRMKELQPEMERIKAKFGSDKSKMNEMNLEVMGLYKKHGVNPMGSCLPMLLQLPIWFGLYQALSNSLDLYQAPFYFWITDLSAPDPFFVFPILWSISLIVYIFVNPQPQQPGQPDMRWMMFAMNIFIGYMSRLWPSGLTVYLFVSNLVGITQQLLMQRAGKKLQPIQEGV